MTAPRKPGIIVLQTKLNRPAVTSQLVVRPRLLQQLNAALDGAITLVVAPAGFGKTTLISSWLDTATGDDGQRFPSTWLSLDDGDKDPNVFLRYFIAALRVIYPEACPETLQMLTARQQPPLKVLRDTISNEIERLPERFVVVLDDLHAPQGPGLFEFLNEWLHHWPRRMHLVLLTRFNPPLPLSSLRVRGMLTEIRARDLRFTQAEASEYLNKVLESKPDESALTLLQQRLEGWIAGLKMASLSLDDPESAQDLTAALLDTDVYINDYLADEVIVRQPPKIQQFLLKTSIFERFSASLAESLMDERDTDCDVRECMNYVESADLFLIPLDNHQEWYRYHHLFRGVLQRKLAEIMPEAEIRELNTRAAHWFFDHDLPNQAIYHALEANDLPLAAGFMEQSLREVLNHEDRPTLERWLGLMPEKFITQNPGLLIMRAYLHALRWEPGSIDQVIRQAEPLIDKSDLSERTQLRLGLFNVLKATLYFDDNQYDQVITYCRQALAGVPDRWLYPRGVAASYMGMSLHASGRPDAAQQFLSGQYESYRDKSDGYALRLLLAVTVNHLQSGNYENAERTARLLLQQAELGNLPVMKGWGYYQLGFIYYEWNELEKAADYFGRVVDMFYSTQLAAARNGMIGQAWTTQALGHPVEALQLIDKLGEFDLEVRGYEQIDTVSAKARLLLAGGNTNAADHLVQIDMSQLPDQSLLIWMGQPLLARARILIARNKGDDTRMAVQILDQVGELAERSQNTRISIEVLALRALALLNLGDSAEARKTLIRSVELARRGQFTRTFVDMGPQMQNLLGQIAGHAPVSVSVGRILAAFPGDEVEWKPAALLPQMKPAPSRNGPGVDEPGDPLTQRELEILVLMSEPISLREIAARMTISYTTARRYTINIYSKFGVHSRWEAVEAAVRRGIISRR